MQWIEGDSSALGTPAADLVLMTSNVAQVFLDDDEWATTLRHIHAALHPGGHLAFESRNPDDRGWERWNPETTFSRLDTPHGLVESWLEVVKVGNGRIHFQGHNVFKNTGEDLVATSELRFRSHAELTTSLNAAGFTVQQVYGDWEYRPYTNASRIMVFIAQRE